MRLYKRITYLVCFLVSISGVFSQIRTDHSLAEIDSLVGLLPAYEGTERADHLNLIATSISQRFPDSCIFYANQAKELSDSLHYEFGKAEAVFNIGNGYFYKIDIRNAMLNYLAAMSFFEKAPPSREYGDLLMQIASLNRYLENDPKAVEYFKKARSTYKKTGNSVSMMVAQYRTGYAFMRSEYFDSAFVYYHHALQECKEIGDLKHLSHIYNNIGITYEWRDDLLPEKERNGGRLAIPFLDSAFHYAKITGYSLMEQVTLGNIGECYHHYINPPDHRKAEEFYLRALQVITEPDPYYNKAEILAWLGELYADMGDYSKAEVILNEALKEIATFKYSGPPERIFFQHDRIYIEMNYSWWAKHSIFRGFMELYQYKGDHQKAILYSELRHKTLDSLNQVTIRNQIEYLMAGAENERITQQYKLLEKEKELQKSKVQRSYQFLLGISILLILVVLIAVLFVRQKKLKVEQEKINLQHKLLRSRMNPHFIFNSLASIQGFMMEKDTRSASRYLSRFATLVRNILDDSTLEYISLEKEISIIENYLELQKARYEGKFDYIIEVDEVIDPGSITVPPMLAQPFIENAIEHGMKHKNEKGRIEIRIRRRIEQSNNRTVERTILEIEDDGIGRQKAQEILIKQDKNHKSLATKITLERIQALNSRSKQKITLDIIDLKEEQGEAKGTLVRFGIPI